MRDASSRPDRAKRFLPVSIDPPIIYKRDPFQLPITEYVVSSPLLDPVEPYAWADYGLGRALLTGGDPAPLRRGFHGHAESEISA